MAATTNSNGNGTDQQTDEATKLARANYADRAAAALPDARAFGRDILKLLGEYDPDHVTAQDCRRMMDDYTVKMSMHYSMAPLVTADYSFECEDPRILAAVKENYDRIHVPLMLIALSSWIYGYQGCVKVFEFGRLESSYEDPETGEVKPVWPEDSDVEPVLMGVPVPLPPETTEPEIKRGKFAGIRTSLARFRDGDDGENNDLVPPEHSMWFVHQFEQTFRNWYGRSRLVPVYKPWYSFWANWYNRDRNADQDADPALQVWYPPGDSWVPDPDNPTVMKKIPNREAAQQVGHELRNGATIVWPSDVHVAEDGKITTAKKWEAAFLKGGENLAVFNDLLDRLEVAKYRACLVPEQTLIEAIKGTGARNVTGEQSSTFAESLEMESTYFDRQINDYMIRPFVEANFGADAATCRKVTTGFREEDLSFITELIMGAFNADPNALPINFEALLEQAKIAMYSKKEQEERQKAVDEAAAQAAADAAAAAPVGPLPGEDPTAAPGAPASAPLALSVQSTAPRWARDENARREANMQAVGERLRDVVLARYQEVFETAADALAEADLSLSADMQLARRGGLLGRGGVVPSLMSKIKTAVEDKVAGYSVALTEELASMYHAAGAAELIRLNLATDSWDVGRRDVQDWAAENAGRLITTMDETVIEKHIRPWLERELGDPANLPDYVEAASGVPIHLMELSAQLTDRFSSYPEWMAERVVRTEARLGYNESAADMWDRVGVTEVDEWDGLGGLSGQTDEECLARNGRRVDLDTFRRDNREEHPNGTLGARPVTTSVRLRVLAPDVIYADARRSGSMYAVDEHGLILDQEATGLLLAA
jgi:hypothetical protein